MHGITHLCHINYFLFLFKQEFYNKTLYQTQLNIVSP